MKAAANTYWAALDLGSNSFHLLLVRQTGLSFVVVEKLKEKVQLLANMNNSLLDADARQRGIACLQRFAQRLRPLAPERIVIMGTHALRQAANAVEFVRDVEQVLQAPVQIISGEQEAQLIYLGVTRHVSQSYGPRLVLDIGGGSTEVAYGERTEPTAKLSVAVGCVAYKEKFFDVGRVQSIGFSEAKTAAVKNLRRGLRGHELRRQLRSSGQLTIYGTSGTVASVLTVLGANGWPNGTITAEAMVWLEQAILADRWVIEAGVPGLDPDRIDIFPAGAAILSACFDVLNIEVMHYVPVTLLQGMMGKAVVEDITTDLCEDSVAQLMIQFSIDEDQARRVSDSADRLFHESQTWWRNEAGEVDIESGRLLNWAARLHEIGVQISSHQYHRHGAYMLKHADLPGFNPQQQAMLALLVRGHRRSLPALAFQAFDPQLSGQLLRLVALLRIAVILQRSHHDADSPEVTFSVKDNTMHLRCPAGWLMAHPLSAKELQVETGQLHGAGLNLIISEAPPIA